MSNDRSRSSQPRLLALAIVAILLLGGQVAVADCIAPLSGLTSWWPADGSVIDVQGGRSATLEGDATYGAGNAGQAFLLDGDGDFVSIPDDAALDVGNGDFTVDLWVNFDTTAGEQVLIEKYIERFNKNQTAGWTFTKLAGNSLRFATPTQDVDSPTLTIPIHEWVHFAARRSGQTTTLFLNGVPVAANTFAADLDSSASLKLGHRGNSSDTPGSTDERGFFVRGAIDEAQIFVGHALSDVEIAAIHAAGADGQCLSGSPACGNGRHEAGEPCDDGNLVDGDGCDSNCTISCGNGVTSAPETCDDGNLVDDDGCDHNCTVTGCGNGIVTGSEPCDDGNANNDDACLNGCVANICGDGYLNLGPEHCDDGNLVDGDGCDHNCNPPCVLTTGLTSWWKGDGSAADSFGGHDANLENGATFGTGQVGQAFALDGDDDFVSVPHSAAIDFGQADFTLDFWVNFDSTDGEQVMLEKYVEAFGGSSVGWSMTKLGDNSVRFVIVPTDFDTPPLSIPTGTWVHFAARRAGNDFTVFYNGTVVATKTANPNLDNPSSIKFGHRGGPSDTPGSTDNRGFFVDGRIDEVQLFVGYALPDADVQAIYAAGSNGVCPPLPICGNGAEESGELCDDGNDIPGDGCESGCVPSCGNGAVTAPEECDDGNLADGDGCDHDCSLTACGNGILTAGELCDDHNHTDGDGCDNNCSPTGCGNGIATDVTGETCDDGNLVEGDGCASTCTLTTISQTLGAGDSLVMDPNGNGATPAFPVVVSVTSPNGGVVSIDPPTTTPTGSGFLVVGTQLQITAPPASVADPLVIAVTVDEGSIPTDVDPSRLDLLRDGVPIVDCTGIPGTASPDPCIESRAVLVGGDVRITALSSHASLWSAIVRGLAKPAQTCVTGANTAGARVARVQSALNLSCLVAASKGREPDPAACMELDAKAKVSRAADKTTDFVEDHCAPPPAFAFTSDTTINDAGRQAQIALMADLFGDPNTGISTDGATATCQKVVYKSARKLLDTKVKEVLACEKSALAGSPSLAVSAPDLVDCFAAVDADSHGKIARKRVKLASALTTRCAGVSLEDALPGACATSTDRAECLDQRVDCRLCRLVAAMGGLAKHCDLFDDDKPNESCP